ncbi:hypothetical protein BD408DRAFT_183666 [Parasitella parasitica]|nr:hypothetical protein BD408DRAFT_183666 [Parasitella parasitica]
MNSTESGSGSGCMLPADFMGCIDRGPMQYMLILKTIWVYIWAIASFGLLWQRVTFKKLPIFDFSSPYMYTIIPKPIESMLLFISIFNTRRHAIKN